MSVDRRETKNNVNEDLFSMHNNYQNKKILTFLVKIRIFSLLLNVYNVLNKHLRI